MIKAMILCAGGGTRLKPLTDKCPKPMLDINGKPLLEHIINLVKSYNITKIAINLYHHPDTIMKYFGDGSNYGVKIKYSIEENLMGTAGALDCFRDYFNDTFIVIYGDIFSNLNLNGIINFHKNHKGIATIVLYNVENPTECGIVELNGNGRIVRFVEKPNEEEVFTDLANAGVYILEPNIMRYIPRNKPFDFGKDLFPKLLNKKIPIYGFPIREYLMDIGTKNKYEKLKEDFIKGRVLC